MLELEARRPMNRCPSISWLVLLALALPAKAIAAGDDAADHFESQVRPIIVRRCVKCHGEKKQEGELRLDRKTGWVRGGDQGPAILPGKPEESLLIKAVRYTDDNLQMPPDGKLVDREIASLVEWIKRGAFDPRDGGPVRLGGMSLADAKRFWSLQPVKFPSAPVVAPGRCKSGNAIDAFLTARMDAAGLMPLPPADKRTLIRRATYDLIGLPPLPDEVERFLADDAPDAFARVVDRLLASPHYGERWGRHWLDLVRYADTAGENTDHPLPHAWRYRNWVIAAFNRDMPYDEFVRDQVAGDILAAAGPRETYAGRVVATGFLALARRFGHDIDQDIHLTHEDVIDTLGKVFLGLSLGCARCHAHKYDPISAEDYYALYGIFESTKFSFPGCEPKQQPHDLVPLVPADCRDGANKPGEMAYAVTEGTPRDSRLHVRGDPEKRGAVVPRRWLEVLGAQPVASGSGSGRKQLAEWLTAADNPLFARVIVNRIWQYHFGKGLVTTPSDFGTRGLPPTHPELLDWLAARFALSGWRTKPMHRLIMLSDAYQRASVTAAIGTNHADAENHFYWRFNRRRLSAEELRDSLLLLSGQLDPTPGGPHPFPPESSWNFTQHNPFGASYDTNRRGVYLMVRRNRRDPFLALFDGADPNTTTPVRQETTVPTQALYVLNAPFFHEQSRRLAVRLESEPDPAKRLEAAFQSVFQRSSTVNECDRAQRFMAAYGAELRELPAPEQARLTWAALARVLLSSNEFIYLD
jgi:Protein of unknown function (DUF1553)/Protein of unknown function (DUF1549)/Planctomycete cytochrome C